jgi:hypothetical protein
MQQEYGNRWPAVPADLLCTDKRQLVRWIERKRNLPAHTTLKGGLRYANPPDHPAWAPIVFPRNDEAGTFLGFSFQTALSMQIYSRGALRARVLHVLVPPERRGQGRPGGRCTRGPRAKRLREVRVDHRYRRDQPGLPCAMVYGLLRALPGEPAFATVALRSISSAGLSACMGAPGPHDFAVRERCRSSVGTSASTAFRSTFVTTRTPLASERNADELAAISEKKK